MTLERHLLAQACNNAWANHRLLTACSRLDDVAFAAPRVGFFPSLQATLNHVLTVDWYYVDAIERALRGAPPDDDARRFFTPEVPCPRFVELDREQRAVDRRLIAVCRELCNAAPPGRLEGVVSLPRSHGMQREPLGRLLAHLFQHQVHHRGQAHAMLSGTAVAPPQLDEFFCASEAHLRAADLAALGLTEQAIWGPTG